MWDLFFAERFDHTVRFVHFLSHNEFNSVLLELQRKKNLVEEKLLRYLLAPHTPADARGRFEVLTISLTPSV